MAEQTVTDAADIAAEAAMGRIVAAHEAPLLRYAARLLNDAVAAQDVVQEAFVRLASEAREGRPPAAHALAGWLYRVVHNAAVDWQRRESRLSLLHRRHAEEQAPPPDPAPEEARMEAVLAQARALPHAEQQVLVLRLQEGLSYKAIAALTGRSEGNVGCLLHHAVKTLAARFQKAGMLDHQGMPL